MSYLSRAPMRVSFAGGGTDVSPYPETRGGAVLSAAITRHCHASLTPRQDGIVSIRSLDYGIGLAAPRDRLPQVSRGPLGLLLAILRAAGDLGRGLDLVVASEAAPKSGLGASSALVVAVLGAVRVWQERPWTDGEIAELAYYIERVDAGVSGGRQDQYAAAFGGFNFMEFLPEQTVVNRLHLPPDVAGRLRAGLLLCFTGKAHPETDLIRRQVASFKAGDPKVLKALDRLKELAGSMREALVKGDLTGFAGLLAEGWEHKKALAEGISDPAIDAMYRAAVEAGALGGKLLGSGGGGHLLLCCPPDRRDQVKQAVAALGATEVPFAFSPTGVQVRSLAGETCAG